MRKTHYVFITGGVVSSLGKGIVTAALGTILEARGLALHFIKLDPYLNIDPGTLSPEQHGEVFVTEDGTETDLDLGHYERFTQVKTTFSSNYTAGKIYSHVLEQEREGKYEGATVQTIPHVTDAIKQAILNSSFNSDITLIEVGGTVGDIEALPFLEAIRQMRIEVGASYTYFIHLTLVPYLPVTGETKTKPTQHSTKELRSIGIQPNMLICRSSGNLPVSARHKIALFSNIDLESVISLPDVDSIYKIPLLLHEQTVDTRIIKHLQLKTTSPNLDAWKQLLTQQGIHQQTVTIGIVGKYTELTDSYKSITEALIHAGIHTHTQVKLNYIDADHVPLPLAETTKYFKNIDAILVPGGFGKRGITGKISAAHYARLHQVPYLGICLGMQTAIIEFARYQANLTDANSTEFQQNTPYPVVALITEWKNQDGVIEKRSIQSRRGGTMRLGKQTIHLQEESRLAHIYDKIAIAERHRHRYEVNAAWVPQLEQAGLYISGKSMEGLVEAIELKDHPWFIGCQFHPEFSSNPREGHPLFISFIQAASLYQSQEEKKY